jgi:hypothetical protein
MSTRKGNSTRKPRRSKAERATPAHPDLRALAAAVLGCRPEQLLSFYAPPDGGVMAVGPQGQKVYLNAEQLEQIEQTRRVKHG